ncbi:hypothetical protein LCGC14_1274880 [marine sediment metagenome]|uniref:Large polyvalent protein associated domain-containing protein n=1 Tax=marine sediment metagenome TaxID=412755 RepID=A0A0F9KWX1_9ZZZZ
MSDDDRTSPKEKITKKEKDIDKLANACIQSFADEGIDLRISQDAKDRFLKEAKRLADEEDNFDVVNSLNQVRISVIEQIRKENAETARRAMLTEDAVRRFEKNLPDATPSNQLLIFLDAAFNGDPGTGLSANLRQKEQVNFWLNALMSGIEKIISYGDYAGDLQLQRDIAVVAYTKEGSDQAKELFKTISDVYERMRVRLNNQGVEIGRVEEYVFKQVHLAEKMQRYADDPFENLKIITTLMKRHRSEGWAKEGFEIAFKRWNDYLLPKLNMKRTFWDNKISPEGVDKIQRGIFRTLTNGFKSEKDPANEERELANVGNGSLATRLAYSRFYHFSDADGLIAYNEKFGNGTVADGIYEGITSLAKKIALLKDFGPNPNATFNKIIRISRSKRVPNRILKRAEGMFSLLSGNGNIPVTQGVAATGRAIRAFTTAADLGMVLFSSVSTDLLTKATEIRNTTGVNFISAALRSLEPFYKYVAGTGKQTRKDFLDIMTVNQEVRAGLIIDRWGASGDKWTTQAGLMSKFLKTTGLPAWDRLNKETVNMTLSRFIDTQKNKTFDKLTPTFRKTLLRFKIDKDAWNYYRVNSQEIQGKDFIGPTNNMSSESPSFLKYAKTQGLDSPTQLQKDNLLDDLHFRMSALFMTHADSSIVTPSLLERWWRTLGTPPGTVLGELVRNFSQFKVFSLAFSRRFFSPLFGNIRRKEPWAWTSLITVMAGLWVAGAHTLELKRLLEGREPSSINTTHFAIAAFLQGGGLGFYGNWLLGNHTEYGQGLLSTSLEGASGQVIDDAFSLITSPLHDGNTRGALRTVVSRDIPLMNLWYANAAFKYLFLFSLLNFIDPGYVQRKQAKRTGEDNGPYIVAPSHALDPFGSL